MMGWNYSYQNMMNGNLGWSFGFLGLMLHVVILFDLILFGIWLWKQINKK